MGFLGGVNVKRERGFLGGTIESQTKSGCGANAEGGGGFQPGNDCGGEGGSAGSSKNHKASEMPKDMDGDVEILDTETGNVLSKLTAAEARSAFAEEMKESGTLEGLSVRKVTSETEADSKRKDDEFWSKRDDMVKESERQEKLNTGSGLLSGHQKYVEPPDKLYHATFNADDIVRDGFKSSDDLGKQTLGGSASNTISFTTKANAEQYRDGLEFARLAAQGKLSNAGMIDAASKFGVTRSKALDLLAESQKAKDPSHEFFQKVSFEGKKFPLFMGGSWPEHLNSAKPASIVSVDSSSAGKLLYAPGETEWRATEYSGMTANKEPAK